MTVWGWVVLCTASMTAGFLVTLGLEAWRRWYMRDYR
jgi:hypothetical protein